MAVPKRKTTKSRAGKRRSHLKVNPKNVIAIGDAEMDFEMASNSGLRGSILVSTGQNTIDQLRRINEMSITSLNYLSVSS